MTSSPIYQQYYIEQSGDFDDGTGVVDYVTFVIEARDKKHLQNIILGRYKVFSRLLMPRWVDGRWHCHSNNITDGDSTLNCASEYQKFLAEYYKNKDLFDDFSREESGGLEFLGTKEEAEKHYVDDGDTKWSNMLTGGKVDDISKRMHGIVHVPYNDSLF
jgi:hypothetical protein